MINARFILGLGVEFVDSRGHWGLALIRLEDVRCMDASSNIQRQEQYDATYRGPESAVGEGSRASE